MNDYLFDNPNIQVNEEGDVIPSVGEVAPLNPYRAKAELEATHDWSQKIDARTLAMNAVAQLRVRERFDITKLPPAPNDGSRIAAHQLR